MTKVRDILRRVAGQMVTVQYVGLIDDLSETDTTKIARTSDVTLFEH